MQPLIADRHLLQARIVAALDAIVAKPEVDNSRIAAIGFCFGGLCVLDLARSGANLKGVVSFHGLLTQSSNHTIQLIKAKVLALHGYEDPMVSPTQISDFCQEMTRAQVDWQIHQYGHTQHAFTNPSAHDITSGTAYNALATKRSWDTMTHFLDELFKAKDG
jgi:dienelactone hydrolase